MIAAHDRQRDALARVALAARARRASDSPLHVLHDEEELAVRGARRRASGTTLGWRMRAARRASSRNIATNSGSLRELRVQPLDRDGAREAPGAHEPPEEHGRHAAGRDLVVERIPPDNPGRRWNRRSPHCIEMYRGLHLTRNAPSVHPSEKGAEVTQRTCQAACPPGVLAQRCRPLRRRVVGVVGGRCEAGTMVLRFELGCAPAEGAFGPIL